MHTFLVDCISYPQHWGQSTVPSRYISNGWIQEADAQQQKSINPVRMNKRPTFIVFSLALTFIMTSCSNNQGDHKPLALNTDGPRSTILFNTAWKFFPGDINGAENAKFNDDSWRSLDLPHDWSIEDIPGTDSPLDSTATGGISTGYFKGGTGWYRKEFQVPKALKNKRLCVQFDGVYMDADIWINGRHLGNHPYGYTSFWYDITDKTLFGKKNLIAVRVRNEGKNSRWYTGSGIYRHVWLKVTEPVHFAQWGTVITTPEIIEDRAKVVVSSEILNESTQKSELEVITAICNEKGEEVARATQNVTAEPGDTVSVTQELEIKSPGLWEPDSPVLYKSVTEIRQGRSAILDRIENQFGIRSIKFTTEGFFLNGKRILLKGGCMHHDNGPLGAAAYDRAEERRVELMKASGFNSIRCAHNPPSQAFLAACDKLGIMVIDEAFDMWKNEKNSEDYHRFFDEWWKEDISSMVKRDRNHPSVIMWSIGNEIPERGEPGGAVTAKILTDYIKQLDPSRPVTSAVNGLDPDKDPFFATLDIAGYNYSFGGDHGKKNIFKLDHGRVPERIMYCAESYPLNAFGAWMDVLDNPYVVGDFVWTGFDYLGEASIGWLGYPHEGSFYPWNHAYCGDIDICGFKRPQSYYRDVLWNTGQKLSVFVQPPEPSFTENPARIYWSKWHWQDVVANWNWKGHENEPLNVEVYCAYEKVELFLNGNSMGSKKTNRGTEWIARWKVPYQPGILKAIAWSSTGKADSCELNTAGEPETIHLTADRQGIKANNQDLSYVTVELHDGNGFRNALAENRVQFDIGGPGTIVAVANSNPMSTESYRQPHRKAYQGRCLVVINSPDEPGEILLKASSEGLAPGTITITSD
jgi:beta-galactosidase